MTDVSRDYFVIKQLLDEVFVISRIIKGRSRGYQPSRRAETDNRYRNLDFSGYHKNQIIVLLYIERKKKPGSHVFVFSMTVSNKVCELDMISLRNLAPQSYMT